jgi:Recombination endonuclease VII
MAGHRRRAPGRYSPDPEARRQVLAAARARRADKYAEFLERRRKRYADDPEYRRAVNASNRAYKAARRAEINAAERHRYAADPVYRARALARGRGEEGRRRRLWSEYRMTVEDYDAMLERQGGVCAICGGRSQRRLAVDHCHETRMVRMLLCNACNKGLGNFQDQPKWLRRAADLVEEARARYLGLADLPVGGARRAPEISLRLLRARCRGEAGEPGGGQRLPNET